MKMSHIIMFFLFPVLLSVGIITPWLTLSLGKVYPCLTCTLILDLHLCVKCSRLIKILKSKTEWSPSFAHGVRQTV